MTQFVEFSGELDTPAGGFVPFTGSLDEEPKAKAEPLYGENPLEGPMKAEPSVSAGALPINDQPGILARAMKEGAQLRDEFFSGVDQGVASVKNVNASMLGKRLIDNQKMLADLESRGQGDSINARQARNEIKSLQERLPRAAASAAVANADASRGSQMTTREAVQKVGKAKTFGEAWEAFKEAPYDVIAGVTAQSMPQMLPGLIVGVLAGPMSGALAMGASSGVNEFGNSLGDFAQESGINTADPQAVEAFFSDPTKLSAALSYAGKRAGIIGALDTVSGGIAGKILAPPLRNKVARQAVNLPAQMGVQSGLGAGGEAGAQLATKGKIDQPGQVLLEAVGELGGAPAEVAAFSREAAASAAPPAAPPIPSAEQIARDRGFLRPEVVADPIPAIQAAPTVDDAIRIAARAVDQTIDAKRAEDDVAAAAVSNIARILGTEIPDVGTAAAVPGVVEPAAGGGAPDAAAGVGAGVGTAGPAGQPVDTGGVGGQPAGGAVSLGAGQPGALNFAQPPGPVRQITVTPAGTLTAIGDPKALVRLLKSAGVTNVIPATNGITVGKSQASMARQVLDDFVAAPPENFEQDFQQELEREYQADIKAQLLAKRNPQPVKVEKKTQSPLRRMLRTVGIKPELAADITGERNKVRANNVLPFTFRKNGVQIDELVRIARERGFLTQDEDDIAAGRRLVEMIQADLRGERQESTETIEDAMRGEQDAEIARAAARLGLDTSGMDARQVGNAVNRIERRLARARADGIRREAQAEARIEREAIQAADRRAAGPDRVLDDLDDVPENATLEDAMRALGFTEQEITDAVAQESRRAQADRAGSGGAVAPAAGPAQGGDRRGEGQARQEAGGAETRPQDLLGEVPNASQQAAARLRAEREEQDRRRQQAAPEAGGFMLSGSDRARDVGAAAGQGDLLAGADAAPAPTAAGASPPAQQAEPSEPAEPDYLAELFGTPAQQAAAQAKFTADAEAKKRGMARVRDAIAEQKKRAATEYDEWAGKVYKQNKTQVDLRGDGPSNQASMSIGAINESRRRNAMEALSQEMRALDKLADEVSTDSGAERVQAILSRLYEQAAKIAADGTGLFKTADEQFQYMLLDDLKFRGPSGKGNVTSNGLSMAMLAAIKPSAPAPAEPAPPEQQEGEAGQVERPLYARGDSSLPDEERSQNFRRWSNDAPLVTSSQAGTYQFKSGRKVVVEAFHGTKRPDRVGTVFQRNRATSGPMAFFTSSPLLASSYAEGKQDTSLSYEEQDYANWFKYKPKGERTPVDIVRAWYRLPAETKKRIADLAPRVRFSEEQEEDGGNKIELGPEDHASGTGSYDYNLDETKTRFDPVGNPLKALVEDWLNSANLFNDEERFLQVLRLAGFPVNDIAYDSPHSEYPFVYKAYVFMQKPLVTSDIPQEVRDALNAAAKRDRSRPAQGGADMWDKNTRSLREWVAAFNGDRPEYVWTSIPDKVTEVFKSLGYDGIIDWSGKGGGTEYPVYIPFEETQVKSALGNKGTFSGDKKDILLARSEPSLWYSELSRKIGEAKMNASNPEGWKAFLSGLPQKGVKPDEIEWSGIREWLGLQQGKVSKEAVLTYLGQNGVQVQEVTLGGTEPKTITSDEALERLRNNMAVGWRRGDQVVQMHSPDSIVDDDSYYRELVDNGDAEWIDTGTNVGGEVTNTKYGSYTLPGGTNYREVLLTLPEAKPTPQGLAARKAIFDKHRHAIDAALAKTDALVGKDRAAYDLAYEEHVALMNKRDAEADAAYPLPADQKPYKSGHWTEPNILAHIRLNDRTDADGGRVLFVEEIQSDWAQAGRKHGINKPKTQAERAEMDAIQSRISAGTATMEDRRRYTELADETSRVPAAPFIDSTDKWLTLALKRVMVMAAQEGYDRVAFVNGEQSADRYSLSKSVDSINWQDLSSELRTVQIDMQGSAYGGDIGLKVNKSGVVEIVTSGPTDLKGKNLEDVIGKAAAEKIMAEPKGNLSGDGLKIGGEGMIAFYDKIVPAAVNKLLGKVGGGKVETVRLSIAKSDANGELYDYASGAPAGQGGAPYIVIDQNNVEVARFNTQREAAAEADRLNASTATEQAQPGFDITPAMREKLAGGMPLFGREDRMSGMQGADIAQVRAIVDGIRKTWKGGPSVEVVASYRDLPGRPEPDARGMYIGGKVYVVASSHRAGGNLRQAVAKTLSHEVIAHYGLRKILGADFDRLLTKPMQLALASGNKPLNALRDRVKSLYRDKNGNYSLSKREESDEIAARAVENAIDADGNFRPGYAWLKSVWARVAQFLRDMGISVQFTQAELQGMLVQAQQAVRKGERLAGASTVVVTQQPVLSRRSAEDVAPADGFWSKIKAGKSFTPKEIADAYARGVRGTVRAFAGFSGEKGGMAAVPGTEHAGWRDEIAGFDGYVTVGVSFADGSLAMGVIPRELYPGRGSALGLGDLGEYSLATYAFTPNPDGSYRLDVFDPRRGGRVFDELARRGRLEETGDTDVAGQPYYRAVFDNRYTTSHSLIQEAVRRLGYHLGAVPTVVQIGRDTGSRANPGKEQVRTFTPEFIERRLARAFHGTPHEFDRFSLDKIGTGEGGQAYGWGLYFASKKEIAEHYRKTLTQKFDSRQNVADKYIEDAGGDRQKAVQAFKEYVGYDNTGPFAPSAADKADFDETISRILDKKGKVYEVDIPEDGEYLLWDKPMSEQPEKIKDAILYNMGLQGKWQDGASGERRFIKPPEATMSGGAAYARISRLMGGDRAASEAMRAAGIRGIKYLDGGSRADGDGTFNYVIFDDADVEITGQFARSMKDQTDIPAFRAWFKDSKVVDAEGKPLVVYHGTKADVQSFNMERAGASTDAGGWGRGIYFAADPDYSAVYAGRADGSNIMPVYVALQNPLTVEVGERAKVIQSLGLEFPGGNPSAAWAKRFADAAQARGHDGVLVTLNGEPAEIVAFHPEQIKSAIGNNGEFDPANPDIRYALASNEDLDADEAPAQRSRWLDDAGRLRFLPGTVAYDLLGKAATPLLNRAYLKTQSKPLRRAIREMKLTVQKAQDTAEEIGREVVKLTDAEREMVSDIIEKELATGVVPPEHAVKLAATMNEVLGKQTDELVKLGMLATDTAEQWRGKYLARYYKDKLGARVQSAWDKAISTFGAKPMRGLRGNHFKGRGLFEVIPEAELPAWEANGWEVRDPDYQEGITNDGTVRVWRDFTRAEREKMGEIRDAGFRFVMGYMETQKDIALGRMFQAIAADPELSSKYQTEELSEQVPDGTISGTGVKKYGKLAGRWVSKETISHLSQIEESQSEAFKMYRKAMGLWKETKTSLNPVSHANNIVSNITMAHFAGVSYWDGHKYAKAMRDFAMKSDSVKEAKDAGLFLGTVSDAELMNVLPEDLKAIVRQQEGALTKVGSTAFNAMTWFLRKPMGAAYQAEDTFFRYLIWKDARDRGMSTEDAVDYSLRYIFAYDDLPRTARYIRDFGIPFFAYTYKAIPALLHTALNYPWRFAAPAAVMWGVNAAAYAIAVGDEDDDWIERLQKYLTDPAYREKARAQEKMEREYLPEWMKGNAIMGTPKAIRLGMDEVTKLPLFIDVYRMVPGGDMLDMNNNAGGTPWLQPFTPNHPLLTTYMAMFGNRDGWTGKDVVDKNDTSEEATQKRLGWMWRQTAPALAYGNYHFERSMQALANATGKPVKWAPDAMGGMEATGIGRDGLPVQPKYAGMQTFGLKVRPIDVEMGEIYDNAARAKTIREIDAEMRRLQRLNSKGAVSDAALDREREKANLKKDRLNNGLTVDGNPR